nr:trypsin-like serine protease [Sandarakinorhabdus sp.]
MRRFAVLFAATAAVASPALAIDNFDPAPNPAALSANAVKQFAAVPAVKIASGTRNGLNWAATSRVIGQTATSDVLPPSNTIGGGNPLYKPAANKSGTVALIMEYSNGDRFICSGSVLADGRSIATAAHCVSDGAGTANPVKTTVHFYNGNPDERAVNPGASETRSVTGYFVHPEYSGQVIDQNDIAILRINRDAPDSAQRYDLFTPNDLTGTQFNVAGYGTRSTTGGVNGNTAPFGARTGFLREGDNIYDYAWGDARFQSFFTELDGNGENFFFNPLTNNNVADYEFSYISDFDNGLRAQDQSRRIANALGLGPLGNTFFDNVGVGDREVGIAGGDSGGPGFVDGKLASINSYGLTFGANFGDFDGRFNAGWGEFSGYVPIYIHTDFIASTALPEPASWAMLIIGFGLTGATMRRRRGAAVAA